MVYFGDLKMSLMEIGKVAFGFTGDLNSWFQSKRLLLASTMTCSNCSINMDWVLEKTLKMDSGL